MTMLRWAVRGCYWRRTEQAMRWLAPRLPHRLTAWTLAHVAAATIRPDENVADARWMDVVGRWDARELQGRAAERHRRRREADDDREAAFQANLARVLADPSCPFCPGTMVDGRCPDCAHDPSTRRPA